MSSAAFETFRVIDSHTAGEPTRIIIEGGPDLGNGPLSQRREILRDRFDHFRRSICTEPRGSDVMVGGLLCKPVDPTCAAGIIFFNNVSYLGMCGHGTIGLITTLAHLGRITQGVHRIETPVGVIKATLHEDSRVSVRNVASYRHRKAVSVSVPGFGEFAGDIAYGGNWFFLIQDHGQILELARASELTRLTLAIMNALEDQKITGKDSAKIDHVELFGPPTDPTQANSRSFVLCPGGAYDRSPCGTGTSVKIACLAADNKLAPGQIWKQQSIVGGVFEASYMIENDQIIPTITGSAHVNADVRVLMDPNDPFRCGIS
jgi:4-hydroxyproline epimerase